MRALVLPVGDDRYALALEQVNEVVETPRVTPLPHSPVHVLGVMNLRGAVVPVIDTGRLLQVEPLESAPYAAVARSRYGEVALALSAPPDVVELGRSLGEADDERASGRYDLDGHQVATLLDLDDLAAAAAEG